MDLKTSPKTPTVKALPVYGDAQRTSRTALDSTGSDLICALIHRRAHKWSRTKWWEGGRQSLVGGSTTLKSHLEGLHPFPEFLSSPPLPCSLVARRCEAHNLESKNVERCVVCVREMGGCIQQRLRVGKSCTVSAGRTYNSALGR